MDNFLARFDINRDSPALGLCAFALFWGASFIFAMSADRSKDIGLFQAILAQVIFVPLFVLLTMWCYQHPEQLDNNPDGWMSDMRPVWPFAALLEMALLSWSVKRWQQDEWGQKALSLMQDAHRLLAEGRIEEADAAYAKGRWILDCKCKDLSAQTDAHPGFFERMGQMKWCWLYMAVVVGFLWIKWWGQMSHGIVVHDGKVHAQGEKGLRVPTFPPPR